MQVISPPLASTEFKYGNMQLTISLKAACSAGPRDEFVSCELRNFVGN